MESRIAGSLQQS